MKSSQLKVAATMGGVLLIALQLSIVQAGTIWTGGGAGTDDSWGNPDNWGGVSPAFDGSEVLQFATTSTFGSGTTTTMGANRAMLELEIGTTTDFSIGTSAETLQLTHLDHQSTTGTGQHTIDANIELQGNGLWTMKGSGGTRMTLNGVISDDGNNHSIEVTSSPAGRNLRLTGTNTYTGGTTLNSGTLEVANSSVFGTGPIAFNGTPDIVKIGSIGGALNFTNNVDFAGGMSYGQGSSGPAITWSGPINFSDDVSFGNVGQAATGVVTLDGDVTESGGSRSLTLSFGNRTFAINGDNSYTGGTTLTTAAASQVMTLLIGHNNALGTGTLTLGSQGSNIIQAGTAGIVLSNDIDLSLDAGKTLQLGGNGNSIALIGQWSGTGGDVSVLDEARLGGTGTLTGDVTFAAGSTLAPGASTGILGLAGVVTLASDVLFDVELEGTIAGVEYDQVQMSTGSIDLADSTLQITHNNFSTSGAAVMLGLINNAASVSLTGQFTNYANGDLAALIDGREYFLYYNADLASLALTGGNDVVLFSEALPVPEPSGLVLLSGGLGLLSLRRKRKRQTLTTPE